MSYEELMNKTTKYMRDLENKVTCLCLSCEARFTCDFALSAWAGKARMKDKGEQVSFITVRCSVTKAIE